MSDQKISEVTLSATSLPASADGQLPCDSQDGRMTDLSGQAPAPVSPSPQREIKKVKKTKGTSGQSGANLLPKSSLQLSLESKLQVLFPTDGSTECTLTWKAKVTSAGRQYCQLAASTRPIREIDSGLWGTALAQYANGTPENFLRRKEESVARGSQMGICISDLNMQVKAALAAWPTPQARDFRSGEEARFLNPDRSKNLNDAVKLETSMWGTPRANDAEKRGNIAADPRNGLPGQVMDVPEMATWSTPNTMDGMEARSPEAMKKQFETARPGRTAPANLREQVQPELYPMALRTTPSCRDLKDTGDLSKSMIRKDGKSRMDTVPRQVFGTTTNGSSAGTVKSGASPQLNPAFVSWLMGYSAAHHSSMLLAMQSYLKSRRGSSKRACKKESE